MSHPLPRVPIAISRNCPGGCVCLQFGATVVYLPRRDFESFVELASTLVPAVAEGDVFAHVRHRRPA